MNFFTIKKEIENWIKDFLSVPNKKLSNWSPCPYASAAINKKSYKVFLGSDIFFDLKTVSNYSLKNDEVIILAYSYKKYPIEEMFFEEIKALNDSIMVNNNLIALGDHPDAKEEVNGVSLNQGKYVLILIQNLADLNQKAKKVAKSGFYSDWPEEYLKDIFQHREDPRSEVK